MTDFASFDIRLADAELFEQSLRKLRKIYGNNYFGTNKKYIEWQYNSIFKHLMSKDNECTFMVAVRDNEVFVIDFKSSKDYQDESIGQVTEYIKIIKKLYPKHFVKGLIIYLDRLEVEEVV